MRVLEEAKAVHQQAGAWKGEGASLGFVPTMGYLHAGHASLIQRCCAENQRTVVSIFVNPTQFGPGEDLDSYPRDEEGDRKLCSDLGVDLLFLPKDPQAVYSHGHATTVRVEELTQGLCGARRPGHFDGVCTVVAKLLNIVAPHRVYFGQKDFQQLQVIRRMVVDLNMPVEVLSCPIVREADGLAMSSRNARLSPEQRQRALVLNAALEAALEHFEAGERRASALLECVASQLDAGLASEDRVDYAQCVSLDTLRPLDALDESGLLALAVFLGPVRLIDNVVLRESP